METKRTNLYMNKRNTVHSMSEAITKASQIDAECMSQYINEIKEIKSTVSLNRKIKYINKMWKSLYLPMFI